MFKRLAYSIPAGYEKNLSFALGFMFHYAGDMFGHTYVNSYAGGWFPPYEEIVKDTEKAKIVARHLLVESYMDSKVPLWADMSLTPSIEFIRDTFYCNDAIGLAPDSMVNLTRKFTTLRNNMHDTLNNTAIGIQPVITDYVQHWEKDVDNGIFSWLEVWAETARIFCGSAPNKIEMVQGYLENWIILNLTLCEISRKYSIQPKNIPANPKIMSFLHSLDGKGSDNSNSAKEKQWEIGFQFYNDQKLREKIFKPLFEVKAEPAPAISAITRVNFCIGDIIDSIAFVYSDGHINEIGGRGGDMHESCEIALYEKIVGISITKCIFDNRDTICQITVKFSNGREQRFSGRRFESAPNKQNMELSARVGQYIYSFKGDADSYYLRDLSIGETNPL